MELMKDIEYIQLQAEVRAVENDQYAYGPKIPKSLTKREAYEAFQKDLATNFQFFLKEYGMDSFTRSNNALHDQVDVISKVEISPVQRQYVREISKQMYYTGDPEVQERMKFPNFLRGKLAEYAFIQLINCMYSYFRLPPKFKLSRKKLVRNGDGFSDGVIAGFPYDVKHRDEGPRSGIILKKHFLKNVLSKGLQDTILVGVTNWDDTKYGDHDRNINIVTDTIALAVTGWLTLEEFDNNKSEFYGDKEIQWLVDFPNGFHPIQELVMKILDKQIKENTLFEYE